MFAFYFTAKYDKMKKKKKREIKDFKGRLHGEFSTPGLNSAMLTGAEILAMALKQKHY